MYIYGCFFKVQSNLVTTAFVITAFRDPAVFYSKPTEMLYFTTRYNGNLGFRHRQCNQGAERVYLSALYWQLWTIKGPPAGDGAAGCVVHMTETNPALEQDDTGETIECRFSLGRMHNTSHCPLSRRRPLDCPELPV